MLEDRTVPSTFTVTNLHDSGSGSLRYEIQQANNAGGTNTIDFASGLHGTIKLTSGELGITSNMTINGPGANKLTVSGNNASRIFNISNNVTANISGLTIANGSADSTGENASTVDVTALGGGGILNQSGSTLNLSKSILSNNTATASSATVDVLGGGLLNEGTANITSSVFRDNQVQGGGGSSAIGGSAGGALDNYGGATLTLSDSTFINNRAIAGDASGFGLGGAIESNAGYDGSSPSTATIRNSFFQGNLAQGGTIGGTANGGAILSEGGGSMNIAGSRFFDNQAVGGANADGETTLGQGVGGGIADGSGPLQMSDCLLVGNRAVGGDHGTPTADNPETGAGGGGGVVVVLAQATLNNCTLIGNVAQGGATDAGPGGSGLGGGIENYYGGTVTLNHCTLVGNAALGGQGGAGNSNVSTGLGIGGAIDESSLPQYGLISSVTIADSIVAGNLARGGSGGPGGNGGNGLGGGISVGSYALVGYSADASQLTLTNSIVSGNAAIGGNGGAGGNGGNGFGGGIIVSVGSTATLQDSAVEYNLAIGGAAGQGGSAGEGVGGGTYNLGTLKPVGTTIVKHNYASTSNDNTYP